MNKYHINIFYSKEDEGYIADIPDLKNCSAFGETPQEALEQVLIAQELWFEDSEDIPEALYVPLIYMVR